MERRNKYSIGLLVIVIVLLVGLQLPLLKSARGQVWIWWTRSIGSWLNVGKLSIPNDVSEQVATLTAENVRLRAEISDYQILRGQIGSPSFSDFISLPVEIVADPTDPLKTSYWINKGTSDGVQLGSPAVIYGSALVGIIVELHEHSALLHLTTHPDISLSAEVVSDDNPGRGLAKGRAFTTVELSTVPKDANLSDNLEVVTSGQGSIVPYGLLIGFIVRTINEEHESYQRARLRLPYNPEDLRAVQILLVK